MDRVNLPYEEDTLTELNKLFRGVVGVKYVFRPDTFYLDYGFNVNNLRRELLKTELELYTEYLIYIGYEFRLQQEHCLSHTAESTLYRMKTRVTNAKALKLLRTVSAKKIDLTLSTRTGIRFSLECEDFVPLIIEILETKFADEKDGKSERISESALQEYIVKEEAIAFRRGAPSIMHRKAKLAELLIFLIYYKSDSRLLPKNITSFSNEDCRLVHDYLVFWGLIEDKRPQGISHTYIRTMISNMRKQRDKGFVR